MAMGAFAKSIRASRLAMLSDEASRIAEEFGKRFGMRDGDYIRFERVASNGRSIMTLARIAQVESCFYNSRRGYTARVKVLPLLTDGSTGNTKSIFLTIRENGTGLDGMGRAVERVENAG